MSDIFVYILFVLGFPSLIGGAHYLVQGASSIADKAKIPHIVIGLTIVAFGTSAPELVVSMMSAFRGVTDLAVGNIIGSNIANLLLILGVAAVIMPLKMRANLRWREIPFVLLSSLVLLVLANDHLLDNREYSELDLSDGLTMLMFLAIFFYFTFSVSQKEDEKAAKKEADFEKTSSLISLLMIIGGAVGLALGGQWIVDGSVLIASNLGMSEALIGLTIVAIGTSLPELATSVVAVRRGNSDIAVGNVVGSNIMNVFWILGATATITPVRFNAILNTDIWLLVGATLLFFLFTYTGKKHEVDRFEGVLFLLLYIGYLAFVILRG